LKNPGVADAIVAKAGLKQTDVVLEVGPGTGNLTARILQTARKCVAVEMDPRMAAELTKRFQGKPEHKKLEIMVGDVIKVGALPYFDVAISNTPYQISSPLVFKLLAHAPAPRAAVLMFQREFAQRLVARPGDSLYGRLAANVQMWARVELVMKVGRNNFNPPPQVESSVVRITPKVPRPNVSFDEWDGLLRVAFVRKNKTLRSGFLGTTSVLEMLEKNYRVFCAQNDIELDDSPLGENEEMEDAKEEDEWEGFMDVDEDEDELPDFFKEEQAKKAQQKQEKANGTKKKKRGRVARLVREKVRKVLEDETELAERRARMCDEGDFLKLLYAFNLEGIHFC